MTNALNIFLKRLLDICFFVGLALEIAVPFGLKYAVHFVMRLWGDSTEYAQILNHYPYAIVSIMLVGACTLMILHELRKMMTTVLKDDCFVKENVSSLVRMSIFAYVIAGLKILRCFVYFTPGSVIIACVFFFAGLFSKVLALVFDRAVNYKQDSDLTI